eukprot:m.145015 g.145015  ORF g.145015 m.145015 type:complete len:4380 (-) comp15021_c0_seq2:110-13249(-)
MEPTAHVNEFEQDVLLGVESSPRSVAYCERDGLWVVGTQNGLAVYSSVPTPMLNAVPALPSLLARTQTPVSLAPSVESPAGGLEGLLATISTHRETLRSALKRKTEPTPTTLLPISATAASPKGQAVRVLYLPHTSRVLAVQGNSYKLLAPDNGVFPITDVFRMHLRDASCCSARYLLNIPLEDMCFLIEGIDWPYLLTSASPEEVAVVKTFFAKLTFTTDMSPSWRRALVEMMVKEMHVFLTLVERQIQQALAPHRGDNSNVPVPLARLVAAISAAREGLSAMCPSAAPRSYNSYLKRLESFGEWQYQSPKISELAAAGLYHDPSAARADVKHFSCNSHAFSLAHGVAPLEEFFRRVVDRGAEPVGVLHDVPLPRCLNVQPASAFAMPDFEPVFLSVDMGTNWVVSVSAKGEVLVLTDHPQLSMLTRFHYTCTGDAADELMDAEGDDDDGDTGAACTTHEASSAGALVGTHLVTDGLPLSNVFVLSALHRGPRECYVRVHGLLRMICMFADQTDPNAEERMLRCIYCAADSTGHYFPDRASLSAHLMYAHYELMTYSDKHIFTEDSPEFLGDVCVPLDIVYAARVVRKNITCSTCYCGSQPASYIILGARNGQPCIASCSLQPLLSQLNADKPAFPILDWTVTPLTGLPDARALHTKILAFGWRSIDDSIAGMAADGTFAFVAWLNGTVWALTQAPEGDRFVDVAYSRELRKIALVTARGAMRLLTLEACQPGQQPPDISGPLSLEMLAATRDALQTSRIDISHIHSSVSGRVVLSTLPGNDLARPSASFWPMWRPPNPEELLKIKAVPHRPGCSTLTAASHTPTAVGAAAGAGCGAATAASTTSTAMEWLPSTKQPVLISVPTAPASVSGTLNEPAQCPESGGGSSCPRSVEASSAAAAAARQDKCQQGLHIAIRMPFIQHVTLVRVECEFELHGPEAHFLRTALCFSSTTDTTTSLAFALKFDLFDGVPQTPHADKPQRIRFRKDLRHPSLALAATSQVSLHFPSLRPGGLVVPICFRFCVLGHVPPFAVAKHLAIPRAALLDINKFSNIPLRLFSMLCDDVTPMATRFASIDILLGLLSTIKPMAAELVRHADFDKLIENGLIGALFPGTSRMCEFVKRLLEVYPPAGAPLFKAVVRALASPQLLAINPLRMFEFMDFVQQVAAEDPVALVEALSTRLVDVCTTFSSMAVDVRYAAFLQTHGISPLLLDPGWARIDLDSREFHDAPLDLAVVKEAASAGLVRLTSPPDEMLLATKCYTIQCAPPCQIVFDLGCPAQITSVRMSLVKASAPSARVSLTCGITRARCCETTLTSHELTPGATGVLEHQAAGPVQFLTVQVGSITPESAFELAPAFETPPGGVGYVVPSVDKQGEFVATPVKYKAGKQPPAPAPGAAGPDDFTDHPMYTPPVGPVLPPEEIIIQLGVYGYYSTDGLVPQTDFDESVLHALHARAEARDAKATSNLLQLLRNMRFHVETMAFQPHINCNTTEIEALKSFAQTCTQAQAEANIARRQLRRLVGHNRAFLPMPVPPSRISKQEQVLVVALSLCRLLQSAPIDAIRQRPLSRQAVVNLIVSACKSCVPDLLEAVLDVLRLQPLTVHEWADSIVQVIQTVLPTENGFVPQRRSTIEALKSIAKVQQLGEPSCNNPLLLETLAHLIPSDGAADQSMLEAALQVIVDALQSGVHEFTSNSIALCIADPFLNKTLLHAKRTTTFDKINNYLTTLAKKPEGLHFYYNGRLVQPSDTPQSLNMSNMAVLMLVPAGRPCNLVEPVSEDPAAVRQHLIFLEQGEHKTLPIYEHSSFVSRVLAQVPDSTTMETVSRKGEWLYVRGKEFEGWTLAVRDGVRCLHVIDPVAITVPTWHRVTTNAGNHGLPIRTAPRSGASLIGRVFVGERLRVLAREHDWARITTSTGEDGYCLFQKGNIVYLALDQGHCTQTSNVMLRMLVNLKPGHEPDPDCVCHSRVCLPRASCVGDVLIRVAQAQGCAPDTLSATFDGVPAPSFATFNDLSAKHGGQLTILPKALVPAGDFLTIRVTVPCFSRIALLKVARDTLVVKVVVFFSRMFDRRPHTFALFHNDQQLEMESPFSTFCTRDLELFELRDIDFTPPDLVIGCFLEHSGTEEVAFNETNITVPKFLFNFWLSPAMLSASRRECFLSLATVIKRLIPTFSLSALLGILKHTRMEQFLQYVITSDVEVQASVTVVLHSLCNHLRIHFDGQRTDLGVTVVSPHPLMQYYHVLQTVIGRVLAQPSQLGLGSISRLTFLVTLCLPRCGLPQTVRVEYHPHTLTLTKRRSAWHCDSCDESFTADTDTIRYRCGRTCDFDVCGACMPFPPPDTVLQPLDTATVLRLFAITFSPNNTLTSTTDLKRMAVLLFTLARTADHMQLVVSPPVWDGVLSAIRMADMAVDLQVRGFISDLLASELTSGAARNALVQTAHRAFETINSVPRLMVWIVDAVVDHTREQTEQGLPLNWPPEMIYHLFRILSHISSRFYSPTDVFNSWAHQQPHAHSPSSPNSIPLALAASTSRLLSFAFAAPGIAGLKSALWGSGLFPSDVSLDVHLLLTLLLADDTSDLLPVHPASTRMDKIKHIVEMGRLRRTGRQRTPSNPSEISLPKLVYVVLVGLATKMDLSAEIQTVAMRVLHSARPDQLDSPVLTLLLALAETDEQCARLAFELGALEFAVERLRIFSILISNTPSAPAPTPANPAAAAAAPGGYVPGSVHLGLGSAPPIGLPPPFATEAYPYEFGSGPFGDMGSSMPMGPGVTPGYAHAARTLQLPPSMPTPPSPRGPLKLLAGLCSERNPATLVKISRHALSRAVCLLLVPLLPMYPSPAGTILGHLARVNQELMCEVLCPMVDAFSESSATVVYDILSLDTSFQWISHIVESIPYLTNNPSRSRPLITLISRMLALPGTKERLGEFLTPELIMTLVTWLKSLFAFRHPNATQAKWNQATSERVLLSSVIHDGVESGVVSVVVKPTVRELQQKYPNIAFDLLIGQTVSVVKVEGQHARGKEFFRIEAPAEFRSIVLLPHHFAPSQAVFLSSVSQAHDVDCMIAAGLQLLSILVDVMPAAIPAIVQAPPSIETTWLVAMLAGSGRTELFEMVVERAVTTLQNMDRVPTAEVQEQLLCLVCAVTDRKNLRLLVTKMQPAFLARLLLHVLATVPVSLQPLARTLVHSCTQCPDTLAALAAEIRLETFCNPFVMELMLSLHERSVVVCLRPRHIHIPFPAIPDPWLLSDVEFLNPEGILLRVPASLTLRQLHAILTSRTVTPAQRTVRTDMDTLVIDGQPLHVGEDVHVVFDGTESHSLRLLAVNDNEIWLCSPAAPDTDVQIVSLAAIRRGSVVLQRIDTASRAAQAEHLGGATLLHLAPAVGPLTLVCELDNNGKMFLFPQAVPLLTPLRASSQETVVPMVPPADHAALPTRMPVVHALSSTRMFALLVALATHEIFHTPCQRACPLCHRDCPDVLHHLALSVMPCGRTDTLRLLGDPSALAAPGQYCGLLLPGQAIVLCAACLDRHTAQPACIPPDTSLRAYSFLQTLFKGVIPTTGQFETLHAWLARLRTLSLVPTCLQVLLSRALVAVPPAPPAPKCKTAVEPPETTPPHCLFDALLVALSGPDASEVEAQCWRQGVFHFALAEMAKACNVRPADPDCPSGNLLSCELIYTLAVRQSPFRYTFSALTHGAYSQTQKPSYASSAGMPYWNSEPSFLDPTEMFGSPGSFGSRNKDTRKFALVRAPFPIPKERFYFEVTIEQSGLENMVGIGLHPTGDVQGMIGWEPHSFGFHTDDGSFRAGHSRHAPRTCKNKIVAGDVVGCGFERAEGLVYFTHNGQLVQGFRVHCNDLYAVVTGADLAEVSINFGQTPFAFTSKQVASRDLRGMLDRLEKRTSTRRKGVGYADDHASSPQWTADAHEERTALQATLLAAILGALLRVVEHNTLARTPDFQGLLASSGLAESLAHIFQNDSLTDMAKNATLYLTASDLTRTLAHNSTLSSLVRPLAAGLRRLNDAASNYLQFSKQEGDSDADETDEAPATLLARSFQATHAVLDRLGRDQPVAMETGGAAAEMSYEEALRPLKLLLVRIAESGHSYLSELEGAPSRSKMSRLALEMSDANSGLPCQPGNAIFLRMDKQRVDLMQCMITGVTGTPYSLGCFVFDVYCPADYPAAAPKVNLITTGNGSLRFNPNLYANGKVCLSLLGTWRGAATESWSTSSTLLQVFISIQSLIMTDDVYFNEPGFDHVRATPEGPRLNRAYSNFVRFGTVRYAMVDQLRAADSHFAAAIKRHFFLNKAAVLQQVDEWLRDARAETDADVCYDGIVNSHNPALAARFASSRGAYATALGEAVADLHVELAKLTSLPPLSPDVSDSDDEDDDDASMD